MPGRQGAYDIEKNCVRKHRQNFWTMIPSTHQLITTSRQEDLASAFYTLAILWTPRDDRFNRNSFEDHYRHFGKLPVRHAREAGRRDSVNQRAGTPRRRHTVALGEPARFKSRSLHASNIMFLRLV